MRSHDGLALHLERWPASPPAQGCVLIVHGLGEHVMRHDALARHLNARGWNAVGHDHRGHGRSEGPRGALSHEDDLLRDLAIVIDAVRAEQAGPLLLLGHSLGGLVAARFMAEALRDAPASWHRPVEGLVLSSPALNPGMTAVQRLMLAATGPLAPSLAVGNGLKPAWVSRDATVVQAYERDPLVHDRITPRLARFIVDAGADVLAHAPQWAVPTLLLYAGSDRCVDPRGSADFARLAPASMVRAHAFPRLFHELFHEPERGEVFAVLDEWLAGLRPTLFASPRRSPA